jgi:hypothetical protein
MEALEVRVYCLAGFIGLNEHAEHAVPQSRRYTHPYWLNTHVVTNFSPLHVDGLPVWITLRDTITEPNAQEQRTEAGGGIAACSVVIVSYSCSLLKS